MLRNTCSVRRSSSPLTTHVARPLTAASRTRFCGVAVLPQQWSTAVFAHYVDSGCCEGCGRYVCELTHTALRDEAVEIVRDGLRSSRYHVTHRYCALCAPLRHIGGIVGAVRWLAIVAVVASIAIFAFQALF